MNTLSDSGPAAPARPVCGLTNRILHVHPGLGCNLRCRHCYSSSGPAAKTRLDPALVCEALTDAAALGYQVAAFSGGEPLLQPDIWEMLAHARAVGLRTALTTNGTLISTDEIAARLRSTVDSLAVSLDGPPDLHNEMRASPLAFERMLAGVRRLSVAGAPFGFIFTLTEQSWEHLVWAGEFAVEQEARLLQLHPLEMGGRAVGTLNNLSPSEETLARAYLLSLAMQERYGEQLALQVDFLHRDRVVASPELVYADEEGTEAQNESPTAQDLNLLILEADGSLVPFSYGFSRSFALGNVKEHRLRDLFPAYFDGGYQRLRALCRRVYAEQIAQRDFPLFNWYELIVHASEQVAHEPDMPVTTETAGGQLCAA